MKCPVCKSEGIVVTLDGGYCKNCKSQFSLSAYERLDFAGKQAEATTEKIMNQYFYEGKISEFPEKRKEMKSTMTFEEFNKYQSVILEQVITMKETKGKEYAHSTDRFANFNRLADRLQQPNLLIAWIYLTKHLDSIESFIKDGKTYSTESIQGRIVDAITYLTLIGGMIAAREDLHE